LRQCHDSGMNEQQPWITWEESGQPQRARWRSESQPQPTALVPCDDTLAANAAFKLISEGTGLLWRGDFHNARQLLQALGRRVDRPPREHTPRKSAGANANARPDAATPAPALARE